MAVAQRRSSKTRKRLRRTHFKLSVSGLTTCPNCGALIKAHHVCPKCNYYAGRDISEKKVETKQTKKKKK
ncbi:MAG TPA: 50S ribosomal protein L32 [Bacilli bacterium]|nr:50S ribosomal protein L32 [Bacilli bacterium]